VAGEYRNAINTMGGLGGRVGTEDVAGSAMVDWAITETLSWTNSARIDFFSPRSTAANFDHDTQPISYNSGLVWKATPDDTLRLLAGRSVQTPSLILMTMNGANFKPSTLDNLELSWDHALAAISSKLHVAVYQEWYSNLTCFANTNVGSSKSTGVDASLEGAAQGWNWNLSLNARSVSDDIVLTAANNASNYPLDFAHTTPKWVGTFGIGKSWGDFEFDLMGKWQSHFKDWSPVSQIGVPTDAGSSSAKLVDVASYLTMTARVGWKITDQLTFSVTAAQFDKKNVYEGAGVPEKMRYLASLTASL
jgi:iron complex outermembrane receptor protein